MLVTELKHYEKWGSRNHCMWCSQAGLPQSRWSFPVDQMSLLFCIPRDLTVHSLLTPNQASLWSVGALQTWSFWLALLWMWWCSSFVQELLRNKLILGKWRQSGHSLFPAVLNQIPKTGTAYFKKILGRTLERLPAREYIKISATKNWRETCSERVVIFSK